MSLTAHYGSTFAGADDLLGKRTRRKVGNNTYLERRGTDRIALILHATDVVTYEQDRITCNTGGWYTVTTKDRINEGLPSGWSITSNRGTWELREGSWTSPSSSTWRYTDGISLISERGTWRVDPRTMLPDEQRHRDDRHNTAMRKLISKYLNGLTTDVLANAWANTAGDCILCRIADAVETNRGEDRPVYVSIGDRMGDTQHLIEHLVEGYYVSHLFMAALSEAGYIPLRQHSVETTKRVTRTYLSKRLYIGAAAPQHGRTPILGAMA